MNRVEIVVALQQHRAEMSARFAVESVALFGSASRDELREDSDVDVLVSFRGGATFDGYFGLKRYLEALLHRPVDLVTPNSIKPRLRRNIEGELLYVT
jgi:predicted nucleotidyltransferase